MGLEGVDHGVLLGRFPHGQVVSGQGGDKDHGCRVLKEVDPLPPLVLLPGHVDHFEMIRVNVELILDHTRRLHTAQNDVRVRRRVIA